MTQAPRLVEGGVIRRWWTRMDADGRNWVRDLFLRRGVRVLAPNGFKQIGVITRRLPGRNVEVRLVESVGDPHVSPVQTWWRGNLRIVITLVVVLGAAPVRAEDQPVAWSPAHRPIADWISTGLVVGQLATDTIVNLRSDQPKRALVHEACAVGLTIGLAELTKALVHRTRPDGSDRKSFYSEHTALATAAAGWRFDIGIPIAFGAGYGRAAAAKHYWSDIAVGAGVGVLARQVCR